MNLFLLKILEGILQAEVLEQYYISKRRLMSYFRRSPLKAISKNIVNTSTSQLSYVLLKPPRRKCQSKRRRRMRRMRRRMEKIQKSRMKPLRKIKSLRPRLSLKKDGRMKYRILIRLSGHVLLRILKSQNITNSLNLLLILLKIPHVILISRLMEEQNSRVFYLLLRRPLLV